MGGPKGHDRISHRTLEMGMKGTPWKSQRGQMKGWPMTDWKKCGPMMEWPRNGPLRWTTEYLKEPRKTVGA